MKPEYNISKKQTVDTSMGEWKQLLPCGECMLLHILLYVISGYLVSLSLSVWMRS